MSNLVVTSEAYEVGIRHAVAAQVCGIERLNGADPLSFQHLVASYSSGAPTPIGDIADEVMGFRALLARLGHEGVEPAGERLRRTFRASGFKRYGPLIDAYNIASFEFGAGLGLHDIALAGGHNITVWRADGTERITPLFKDKSRAVKKGDLVYGVRDGSEANVAAWLGSKDVDSDHFRVKDDSVGVVLVVLGNELTTVEFNLGIVSRVAELIELTGVPVELEIMPTIVEQST